MKTTARYIKGRGEASVHARASVRAHTDHSLVEIDVAGQLNSEHHFRLIASADEAETLARQLLEAAAKIRDLAQAALVSEGGAA
ncbi:hypothetical protein [Burkholderia multivorans]|jgi:hypothetical protein|uniref:hypothetical protein n=1 Tax=Burkholderia multivorans TaxID=87883 RepID=UPI0021BFB7B3|nr:hypothetical protein [Burkholderia multivorans]MDR9051049.1 hypothetical protein [Burkholderia multivorans]MDR9060647.1 hypothetical protein [Burkholderia multivorans]MDR9062687.1 hypothetical protein [Burkholderia multivorans]MDR9078042.1 hypothetical protein [Burkholderia multivorans]MDR9093555.1 hypothetical protein [Burkholderia multivorans]